jgi:Protein of unknown function (DUF1439)
MKFFATKLTAILLCTTLAACSQIPILSGEVKLSAAELNEKVAKRFPIEKSIGGLLEVTLTAPKVRLVEAGSRINADVEVSVRLPLSTKTIQGKLGFSGRPDYVPASKAIFLRDAKIESVAMDNMPDALSAGVAKAASAVARELFEDKPLHTFKAEDFTKYGINYEPQRVIVRDNALVLILR